MKLPPVVRVMTTVLPSDTASKPVSALMDVARLEATVARSVPDAVAVPRSVLPLLRFTCHTSVAWNAVRQRERLRRRRAAHVARRGARGGHRDGGGEARRAGDRERLAGTGRARADGRREVPGDGGGSVAAFPTIVDAGVPPSIEIAHVSPCRTAVGSTIRSVVQRIDGA